MRRKASARSLRRRSGEPPERGEEVKSELNGSLKKEKKKKKKENTGGPQTDKRLYMLLLFFVCVEA